MSVPRGRVYIWPEGDAVAIPGHTAPAAAQDASERIWETPVSRGTPPLNTQGVNELADERLSRLADKDRARVATRVFQLRRHGASYRLIALLLDVSPAAAQDLYLEQLEAALVPLRPPCCVWGIW